MAIPRGCLHADCCQLVPCSSAAHGILITKANGAEQHQSARRELCLLVFLLPSRCHQIHSFNHTHTERQATALEPSAWMSLKCCCSMFTLRRAMQWHDDCPSTHHLPPLSMENGAAAGLTSKTQQNVRKRPHAATLSGGNLSTRRSQKDLDEPAARAAAHGAVLPHLQGSVRVQGAMPA